MKILFKNASILLFDKEKILKGFVIVENSVITKVVDGNFSENEKIFDKVIDCENKILMPGFVNAHTHSAMTLFRGIKDDVCLEEWLFDNMLPLESNLANGDVYWGTMLAIAEQVRAGITSMQDMYYGILEIAQAVKKSGFRANICVGVGSVQNNNMLEKSFEENEKDFEELKKLSELIQPTVYSHSIYTQSQSALENAVMFSAKKKCPISIHLSETLKEVGDCMVANGLTPPQYLESLGFLDRNCTIYHGVCMDKEDIELLASYGTNVVSCPSSNLKLGSGIAPLYAVKNAGINIALGTDGAASNNNLDMFKEMFLAATLQKAVLNDSRIFEAKEILEMATKNGAKALNLNLVGEIKEGYKADIILVDTNKPHWQPCNNLISNLVYSAKSSDVCLTMVNGKILYEDEKYYIGENLKTIFENCSKIVARLKKQTNIK
ncbi:MAG: amidohydrolase [Clostridia bacterium]